MSRTTAGVTRLFVERNSSKRASSQRASSQRAASTVDEELRRRELRRKAPVVKNFSVGALHWSARPPSTKDRKNPPPAFQEPKAP
jgi:hypothetical protein